MHLTHCLLALALGLGSALAPASPLDDVERWAQEGADVLGMADLDSEIARQRLDIVSAESGARWTLGASVGQFQEPLTDSTTRNYSNVVATAGVRIPVIGSADANQRNIADASRIAQINGLQRELQRTRVLRDVRLAYSAYVRNAQRVSMAQAWLSLEEAAGPLFLARTREHALLEADRLALQSGFLVARRDQDRYLLAQEGALAQLRRLSKHDLAALPPEPPTWSAACLQKPALLEALEQRPAVAIKRVEVQSRAQQSQLMRWGGMEAGVSLQQSLGTELGGQGSQGTVLGFDMSMPIDWGGASRARASEAQLKLQQARLDLDQTLAEERDTLDLVLGRLRIAKTDLQRSQHNLDTSLEANREAVLRARTLGGDVLEKALVARYALYLASVDYLDTLQRTDAAQIDVLAYGPSCPQEPPSDKPVGELPLLLAQPLLPVTAQGAFATQDLGAPETLAGSGALGAGPQLPLAWFVWHGETLLQSGLPPLPAQPGRLELSFTGTQLATIASDASVAQTLRRNLDLLHAKGWKVDLLFGDASFVQPQGRRRLLALVRAMGSFALDGINLDLERSDLPRKAQPQWWNLTLATLRAVHSVAPWPLMLTTHYREFETARQGALAQAGVSSAMAMVYVRDLAASTAIAQRIVSRQPGLPMRVVQSVEPQLSAAESGFATGRQASLLRWQEMQQRLSVLPNFQGLAVQSLEHFNAMEP